MKTGSFTVVSLPAGVQTPICGVSTKRTYLRIAKAAGTAFSISPNPIAAAAAGDSSVFDQQPVEMSYDDYGELLRGPWFGFAVANSQVSVYEVVDE